MRITNRMNIQTEKQQPKDLKGGKINLKAGSTFRAEVVEVMKDGLILALADGKLMRASNQGDSAFVKGQVLNFQVLETGDQVLVRPDTGEADLDVRQLLSDNHIPDSQENQEAAKALVKAGLPVNPKAVQDLKSAVQQASKLADLASAGMVDLDKVTEEASIKDLLRQAFGGKVLEGTSSGKLVRQLAQAFQSINANASEAGVTNANLTESTVEGQSLALGDQGVQITPQSTVDPSGQAGPQGTLSPAGGQGQEPAANQQMNLAQVEGGAPGLTSEQAKSQVGLQASEGGGQPQSGQETLTQEVKQLVNVLTKLDANTLAFANRLGADSTLQDILSMEKLIFGEQKLGDQMEGLLKSLNQLPKDLAQGLLAEMKDLMNEPLDLKSMDKLDASLGKLSLAQGEDLQDMKDALTDMKDAVHFLKQVNEEVAYVQIPVYQKDQQKTLEMFVKKRKGKEPKDQFKIYLSLNTHRLDTVKAIVEKNKDRYSIEFRVVDEAVKGLFDKEISLLKERLENRKVGQVDIRTTITQKTPFLPKVMMETTETQGGLDLRV